MENSDPADLDGDGRFDAIDIVILEGENNENKRSVKGHSGCCLVLLAIGLTAAAGLWINKWLT